jgi:hypothetical protein
MMAKKAAIDKVSEAPAIGVRSVTIWTRSGLKHGFRFGIRD